MKSGVYWDWDPRLYSNKVNALVYELTRKNAMALFDLCVKLSPVDSGAYRASWTIAEGAPNYYFVGRQKPGMIALAPPSTPNVSTKFYRKLYVANGAPYASLIENGYSPQAPAGVMSVAVKLVGIIK